MVIFFYTNEPCYTIGIGKFAIIVLHMEIAWIKTTEKQISTSQFMAFQSIINCYGIPNIPCTSGGPITLSKLGVHWPEEGGDDEENSSKLIEEGKWALACWTRTKLGNTAVKQAFKMEHLKRKQNFNDDFIP